MILRLIQSTLLVLTCIKPLLAQDDIALVRTFGSDFGEEAKQIIECLSGGYVVVGTTGSDQSNNTNIYVLRLNDDLTCVWNKVLGTTQVDRGYSIVEDSEGNFVVCGYTNGMGFGGYDAMLMKLDQNGDMLWQRTYGGADWDIALKIENYPGSGYLFCGYSYSNTAGQSDAWLVRVDSNGDIVSDWKIGDERNQAFEDLIMYNDSTIYLGGYNEQVDGSTPPWLLSIDTSGVYNWEKVFIQYPNGQCHGIEKSADGTVLIIGEYASVDDVENAFIGKYFNDGALFFDQVTDNFAGTDIAEGSNYFYIVGNTADFGAGGYGVYFARYTLDGIWITGASFGGEFDENGRSVIVDSAGSIIFAGFSQSYSTGNVKDIYVVKLEDSETVADYTLDILHQACFTISVDMQPEPMLHPWISSIDGISYVSDKKLFRVQIFNSLGQIYNQDYSNEENYFIDASRLPQGLLIVKWENEFGETFIQRIVRN